MVLTLRSRLLVVFAVLSVLAVSATSAFAQATPIPYADVITAGTGLIDDLGLMTFIIASAVVGIALFLFRRAKSAAR